MNAFETYKTYLALKQHFSSDYDFFRYNGQINAKPSTFQRRKDRIFFEKLAKQKNPVDFIVANIVANGDNVYIRDLAYSPKAQMAYDKWRKTKESLTYTFKNDLNKLEANFNSNFKCDKNNHPPLLQKYIRGDITLETVCILCAMTGCLVTWNKHLKGDIIYEEYSLKIRKYIPFVKFDKEKIKQVICDKFVETTEGKSR